MSQRSEIYVASLDHNNLETLENKKLPSHQAINCIIEILFRRHIGQIDGKFVHQLFECTLYITMIYRRCWSYDLARWALSPLWILVYDKSSTAVSNRQPNFWFGDISLYFSISLSLYIYVYIYIYIYVCFVEGNHIRYRIVGIST